MFSFGKRFALNAKGVFRCDYHQLLPRVSGLRSRAGSSLVSGVAQPAKNKSFVSLFRRSVSTQQHKPILTGSKFNSNSNQKAERIVEYLFAGFLVSGAAGFVFYANRNVSPDDNRSIFQRTKDKASDLLSITSLPSREQLLPDLPFIPPNVKRPITVVLDLEDTLVKTTWDRKKGYVTRKRPGLDLFLAFLAERYEVVLFSSTEYNHTNRIIEAMDPSHFIHYRLFKDSARITRSQAIKDMHYLNRPLSHVLVVDNRPEKLGHAEPRENVIALSKWEGNEDDTELIDALPFFKSLLHYHIKDVRPIVQSYSGSPSTPKAYLSRLRLWREHLGPMDVLPPARTPEAMHSALTATENTALSSPPPAQKTIWSNLSHTNSQQLPVEQLKRLAELEQRLQKTAKTG